MLANSLLLLAASSLAAAKTISVTVSPGGALAFSPNVTTAAVGDVVEFSFPGNKHDVVQGPFDKACQHNNGGFYSGFFQDATPQKNGVFRISVNSTAPIWYYCSAGKHCQSGMVGVINAPQGKTLEMYAASAAKAGSSQAGTTVTGGTVSSGGASPSSPSGSPAAGTPAAAPGLTGSMAGVLVAGVGAALFAL